MSGHDQQRASQKNWKNLCKTLNGDWNSAFHILAKDCVGVKIHIYIAKNRSWT